jgi:hypothetical protein
MRFLRGAIPFALVGMFMIPISCSDLADCSRICFRYNECVERIDVTECTDLCEDRADASDAVSDQANRCEDCTEDGACADIEGCWADCPVVAVPD